MKPLDGTAAVADRTADEAADLVGRIRGGRA